MAEDSQMRNIRQWLAHGILPLIAVAGTALGFSACCPEDPFVPTPPTVEADSARQAYLRIVITDFELQPVRVNLDEVPLFCAPLGAFDYPEEVYEAQYWPVDTAGQTLSFTRASGATLASIDVDLPKGSYHTAYLYRTTGGGYDVLVTEDDPTVKPGLGSVRFRIANFAIGTPAVDIIFQNKRVPADVVRIDDLGYGDTTAYLTQSIGQLPDGKSLTVVNAQSGDTIIVVPTVVFFGDAVNTLVMVGTIRPQGTEKFIYFNALQDFRSVTTPPTYCNETLPLLPGVPLYGTIPIGLELAALRFVNAVSSGDTTLDLTLQSQFGEGFPDRFRRNFPGQEDVIQVSALGSGNTRSLRDYFFLSNLLERNYPFRVEVHIAPPWDAATVQPVLVPSKPFEIEGGGRYTVIAYGPNSVGEAETALLIDQTPRPPSGSAAVRFFHGAFGSHRGGELRLRVNGAVGPAMGYGDAPGPLDDSFVVPASTSSTLSVLDAAGNVIATESDIRIDPNTTYTVILSRGPNGDRLLLTAIDENVVD